MKRHLVWASLLTLAVAVGAQAQEKKAEHKFVGVKKCSTCHKAEAKGNQFAKWQASKHAKAFATLASEKSLAIAKEKGLAKAPQESPECLKCHVTGHGKAAELFDVGFAKEDGVGCESCHGAGMDYMKMNVMKDRALSVAAGLVIPDEKTCTTCHNQESPTFAGFDYKKAVALVAHPNPAKGAAAK